MWSVLSLSLCDIGYWSLYYSTIGHCTVLCDIGYWSRNNWATFTMHTSFLKAWRSFTNFFGGEMCVICTLDPQIIMIIFWQKLWPKLALFFCWSRWVCSATIGVNVIRLQVLSVCSGSLPMMGGIGPDQTAIYPLLLLGRHHPPTPTYCIIITLPPTYLRTYGSAICGMEGDFSPTQHIFTTVVSFLNSEQAQTEESRRDVIRYSIPPHIAVWCVW